uniref:Uncharacterized protein n=1 Tax=Aegilops tauschii subsp. strangulata TaxID=200361 RepID=A0A453A461_AEGTS
MTLNGCKITRTKKVTKFAAVAGILVINALSYGGLADRPELVEYDGHLVTVESLPLLRGFRPAATTEGVKKQDGYQPAATAEGVHKQDGYQPAATAEGVHKQDGYQPAATTEGVYKQEETAEAC